MRQLAPPVGHPAGDIANEAGRQFHVGPGTASSERGITYFLFCIVLLLLGSISFDTISFMSVFNFL